MITPDIPATSFGVLAAFCFWRWLRDPTWAHALLAGGALGLAELSKMTWVVLFGVWPAVWLAVRYFHRGSAEPGSEAGDRRPGWARTRR